MAVRGRCAAWVVTILAAMAWVVIATGAATPASASGTGSITIVEVSLPNAAQDFTFTGCLGSGCASFTLDDDDSDWPVPRSDRVTATSLAAGTYTVTQAAVPNWNLTGLSCTTGEVTSLGAGQVTIDLAEGEDVTCTFTNDTQVVTIVEDAAPQSAQDFSFTGCGPAGCGAFTLDDDAQAMGGDDAYQAGTQFIGVPLGTYTVSQDAVPNWSATMFASCGSYNAASREVTFTVTANADVFCGFRNQTTGITVLQDTAPDSTIPLTYTGCGSAGCGTFSLDDHHSTPLPGQHDSIALPPGTYTIEQAATPGLALTAITCDTDETVDLANRRVTVQLTTNEVVTCRFVDTVGT